MRHYGKTSPSRRRMGYGTLPRSALYETAIGISVVAADHCGLVCKSASLLRENDLRNIGTKAHEVMRRYGKTSPSRRRMGYGILPRFALYETAIGISVVAADHCGLVSKPSVRKRFAEYWHKGA